MHPPQTSLYTNGSGCNQPVQRKRSAHHHSRHPPPSPQRTGSQRHLHNTITINYLLFGWCTCFWLVRYSGDFYQMFRFVGLKTMFFELLHAKPCRTIMRLHQKLSFGPETCEIEPTLWLRTCPDLPRPVQEDNSLSAKQVFLLFSQKLHLSKFH